MYLSEVALTNWRSYADATFTFSPPTSRRPLVLIGAMNGTGKTSFLMSLYLGLFGRYGLRHVEGFSTFELENIQHYREAIRKFRRATADADEPTSVTVVFSPTEGEENGVEVKVARRWFFTPSGQPRGGDAFEEVDLYIDGKPQTLHSGVDAAVDRLERYLFPASFMPAFFFDGEQAQTLINNAGQDGIRKSVEVLFGNKILEETYAQIRAYIQTAHGRLGGKKSASSQQLELNDKVEQRDKLEDEIETLRQQFRDTERAKAELEKQQRETQESLARLGGERRHSVEGAHAEVARATREKLEAEKTLTNCSRTLGIALAVSRFAPSISNRLAGEATRERWERLRDGTVRRVDDILAVALPEPAEVDDLVGHLPTMTRNRLRYRFRKAIELIYNPPPDGCVPEYRHGHVKGDMRDRLVALVEQVRAHGGADIGGYARRLKEAREALQDAIARRDRLGNLPQEVEELSTKLTDLGAKIADASRKLGAVDNEVKKKSHDLQDLSAEVGRLQELVARMEPEQKRIAVAERVRIALEKLNTELRPLALSRLEDRVTFHFQRIADRKFARGRIMFPDGGSPILRRESHPDALIEMMSGFERRSFGIAFSLALAEITRRRLPLIIDTPLGNADTEYRSRLLKAITDVDLDQIIVLTHDAEVAGELFEGIEGQVRQTYLVEFDRQKGQAVVSKDSYFAGVGR